ETERDRGPGREIRRKLDLAGVVDVEEALRSLRRAVRLGEAATDEEGLRWVGGGLVEELDGEVCDEIVAGAFAVAVEDEDLVGVRGLGVVLRERREDAVGLRDLRAGDVEARAFG